MRSLTTIIFLTAFFALQYGKLVSYWHCRVTVACDCEKKLDNHHGTTVIKEKVEEIVFFFEGKETVVAALVPLVHISSYTDHVPNIYTSEIFQPPRM